MCVAKDGLNTRLRRRVYCSLDTVKMQKKYCIASLTSNTKNDGLTWTVAKGWKDLDEHRNPDVMDCRGTARKEEMDLEREESLLLRSCHPLLFRLRQLLRYNSPFLYSTVHYLDQNLTKKIVTASEFWEFDKEMVRCMIFIGWIWRLQLIGAASHILSKFA